MKTQEIMEALRLRYAMPEYALIENVANGVGQQANGKRRFADALAMQQFGRSGHYLHGFEVKASRSDWLRELKDPRKADSVMRYCDFWWVVAGEAAIVKDGELPGGWGLLVPRGSDLVCKVQAERHADVIVHDRAFVASIFRRAKEQQVDGKLLRAEYERGRADGVAAEKHTQEYQTRHDRAELTRLRAAVEAFKAETGIDIEGGRYEFGTTPQAVGRAVKLVLDGERSIRGVEHRLDWLLTNARQIVETIEGVVEKQAAAAVA
jgi:hypothetical protein